MAMLGASAALLFSLRDKKTAIRAIGIVIVLFLAINLFVFPNIDEFTGGKLAERLRATSMTNREAIFASDIELWLDNPLFGVGPGESTMQRKANLRGVSFHTEYSRMMAEHGILGILAFFALMIQLFIGFKNNKGYNGKALSISFIIWGLSNMAVNAMRVAAPASRRSEEHV